MIRLIKHEAVTGSGSFEVSFPDGRLSKYFYFDDVPGRRLRPEQLTRAEALEQAKALARDERELGGRAGALRGCISHPPPASTPSHGSWGLKSKAERRDSRRAICFSKAN